MIFSVPLCLCVSNAFEFVFLIMTQLLAKLQTASLPAIADQPKGLLWHSLADAQRLTGLSAGQLRRKCAAWAITGHARQTRTSSGQMAWKVREDAAPQLARVNSPAVLSATSRLQVELTDAQRIEVRQRHAILVEWEEQLVAGRKLGLPEAKVTANYLMRREIDGAKPVLSRITLYRWKRDYTTSGLDGLVDQRWLKGNQAEDPDDPFLARVRELYLTPNQLKIKHCHEYACVDARQQGWKISSYKACQRMLALIPKAEVIFRREGNDAFVAQCEPSITRDYSGLDVCDIWCGDHHRFDVFVQVPGTPLGEPAKVARPWLTAWQDVRSRAIVGWLIYLGDPNSDQILATFGIAARVYGLPIKLQIDNGKDFDAKDIQGETKNARRARIQKGEIRPDLKPIDGAMPTLGVACKHVWPYHGQSKPVERYFGTICDQFSRTWETYCGPHTRAKPEGLDQRIAAGLAPTLDDFVRSFEAYLEHNYHATPHRGDAMDGRSPEQVIASRVKPIRQADELSLALALWPRRKAKVSKQGVIWRGLGFGAFDGDVQDMQDETVVVACNPANLSHALILDLEGRPVALARANLKLPFDATMEDLRAAIKEKKQLRKNITQYHRQRPRLMRGVNELMLDEAAHRHSLQPALPSPADHPVEHVPTMLDDASSVIRRTVEGPSIPAPEPRMAIGLREGIDEPEDITSGRFTYPTGLEGDDDE